MNFNQIANVSEQTIIRQYDVFDNELSRLQFLIMS